MEAAGPPELPGLMAASVWMKLTFLLGMPTSAAERERLDTMPSVTVESSPTAFPIATTQSPTCRSSDRPSGAVGSARPVGLILITARSRNSSEPLTVPSKVRPSVSVTVTLFALLTTCAFVMITPSSERITPLPCPDSLRWPSGSNPGKR